MGADILSDVFRMVRLTGALMFRFEVRGRWFLANSATEASSMAQLLPPGTDQIIIFHIVNTGECWMRHPPGDWAHTRAGDAVMLAHGAAHQIASDKKAVPVPFRDVLGERSFVDLRNLRFAPGTEPRVEIVCGFLGCSRRLFAPLCASLPDFCKVALGEPAKALLRYAVSETLDERPGSDTLRVRMAEMLFMEALRLYIDDLPPDATGWLAAVRDPVVGRALRALHRTPGRHWSVDALAAETGSSRSNLAARFSEVLGEPPMHYLTKLRMHTAAGLLRERNGNVAFIANEVGYGSAAAFQRAFKHHFGMPPGAWRKECESA